MNRKRLYLVIQVLFLAIYLFGAQANAAQAKAGLSPSATYNDEHILQATVQIDISLMPAASGGVNGQIVKLVASGLGSLIEIDGQALIVTHNHWGELLQDRSQVEFRDVENRSLATLSGAAFKRLILEQDAGALILAAPHEIVLPRSQRFTAAASRSQLVIKAAGDAGQVEPGDVVQVAVRGSQDRQQVEVIDAEVFATGEYKGLPTFDLRSLNGQPIQPGDSGGGVWFKGKLVGNLWATLLVKKAAPVVSGGSPNLAYTDLSFAAMLTDF